MEPTTTESDVSSRQPTSWWGRSFLPVRKAVVRGLAIVMPPLLTIVLFLWAWNIIDSYVLAPVEAIVRHVIVWTTADIRDDREIQKEIKSRPFETEQPVTEWETNDGILLSKINKTWIPKDVVEVVESNPGTQQPETAQAYYHRYVQLVFLPRHLVIPAFLIVFFLILYLLGRVFTVGIGRLFWSYIESVVNRLPVISNVYSAVKQVTDFAFDESEIKFTRVVAVEYPRKGLWSMGFVTGESMLDIRTAANEPVISVLMPTSPMPATGFVISVPKSHTIDLNITIDQAIQFCVSCGVVVPLNQQQSKTIQANVGVELPAIGSAADATPADSQDSTGVSKHPGDGN